MFFLAVRFILEKISFVLIMLCSTCLKNYEVVLKYLVRMIVILIFIAVLMQSLLVLISLS